MAWFAIIEVSTGRLHTITEDLEAVAEGFTIQLLREKPDFEMDEWDGQEFVKRPGSVVHDRLDDILNDAELPTLGVKGRERLTTVLERHLDPYDPGWRTYTI